jgi:hypothetical protein
MGQFKSTSIGVMTSKDVHLISTRIIPRDYFYEASSGIKINHNMNRYTRFSFGVNYSKVKYRSQALSWT